MSLLNGESLTRRGVNLDASGAAVGDLLAVTAITTSDVAITLKAPSDRGMRYTYNFDAANLRRWTKALANVRNGDSDAKILAVGDSTTAGIGSSTNATVPALKAWPARLADQLNSYLVPAAHGLAVPKSSSGSQPADTRWTLGTGWSDPSPLVYTGFGGKAMAYKGSATTPGNLVFADNRINADTFDVYYVQIPSSGSTGTFTATATGGTVASVNAATGPVKGVGKVTITAAAAATSNTVTITQGGTSGQAVYILGVEPYLSTTRKVRVGNAGAAGSTTADWIGYHAADTTNDYGGLGSIKKYAPDLTILCLGVNDANALAADTPTFMGRLQTIITAAQVSGDVIIKTMLPSSATSVAALEAGYCTALRGLGLPVVDTFARSGSYATYNAAGFMQGDGLHGNDYSYLDEAAFILSALRQV